MQVKVPKFIEIEDKIAFGMTWKQFLALGVGIGGGAIFYMIFEAWLGVPLLLLGIGFGLAFAFGKWNERSFSIFLGALWAYFYNPHRLIWKRLPSRVRFDAKAEAEQKKAEAEAQAKAAEEASPQNAEQKLSDIAKLLDQ